MQKLIKNVFNPAKMFLHFCLKDSQISFAEFQALFRFFGFIFKKFGTQLGYFHYTLS